MKNTFNTLSKYIFENTEKEYRKETIEGLFRAILEPVYLNQNFESIILLKLESKSSYDSLIKRLNFSNTKILSFSESEVDNILLKNIWNNTEFLLVLGQRYSAALIWDYSYSVNKDSSNICLMFNSKKITDIVKNVNENSKIDLKEYIQKYQPDRRENISLNVSVNYIASLLEDKNREYLCSESEKKQITQNDDTYETAQIVAAKAKFIAHEIKNNLSIINLYSKIAEKRFELLKADEETKKSVENSINSIKTASENVSYLINDLRCLSSPYKTEFSLKEFIIGSVGLCEEKADKSGVSINVIDFADEIIKTDRIKLQCAVNNVIFNAIEASSVGDSITVECKKKNDNLEIIIKNTGEMIPKNIVNKIFEADFTTKETGNGLGLAVCKKQMQLLNGDIMLVSSNEKETVFKIVLY